MSKNLLKQNSIKCGVVFCVLVQPRMNTVRLCCNPSIGKAAYLKALKEYYLIEC